MSSFVIDFARINSEVSLARAIGCDEELIRPVIEANRQSHQGGAGEDGVFRVGRDIDEFFVAFDVPKKNHRRTGEFRTVVQVSHRGFGTALKALTRRLELYLRGEVPGFPSAACTGFVAGSSTYKNAKRHLGARLLLTADIKDFFPTISSKWLVDALIAAGLQPAGAELIAGFTTIGGTLPLGFSSSPMLSNLVCLRLDARFEELARGKHAAYSRYADDLAFSSNTALPTRDELRAVLQQEGFALAEDKFRVATRGQTQVVTGLSIADPAGPRLPRAFKRRLRQEIHLCDLYGVTDHADSTSLTVQSAINAIDGRIGYVQGIEPVLGETLRKRWQAVLARDGLSAGYPRKSRWPSTQPVTVLVDEADWFVGDHRFFAVATVVVDDPVMARDSLVALAKERADDPFYGGRLSAFEKKGFHYSDDPERARDDVCRVLSELPLRASVAFATYRDEGSFADNYLKLLGWLVARKMSASDWESLHLICDAHQEVGTQKLSEVVRNRFIRLLVHNGRRPRALPSVECPRKAEEPLLAIPDYMLGVLGAYVRSASTDMASKDVRRFEQLRDKFRMIRDFDHQVSYNRQRFFEPACVQPSAPAAPSENSGT